MTVTYDQTICNYDVEDDFWADPVFAALEDGKDIQDFKAAMLNNGLESLEDIYGFLLSEDDTVYKVLPELCTLDEDTVDGFFKTQGITSAYEILGYANQIDIGDDYLVIEPSGFVHSFSDLNYTFAKNYGQAIVEEFSGFISLNPEYVN